MDKKLDIGEIKQKQSLPLSAKINMTERRIREWYNHWNGDVYVSFSGGKDSTVLLHIARQLYPDIKAVYFNTPDFPEIKSFVRSSNDIIWVNPKKSFVEIINHWGYPVISKDQSHFIEEYRNSKSEKLKALRWNGRPVKSGKIGKISEKWKYMINAPFKISDKCCYFMKKKPALDFNEQTGLHPIVAVMACESLRRLKDYMVYGCSLFETRHPISRPMSFWIEEDIWNYLKMYNVPYSSIYNLGYERTCCMFCLFGVHLEGTPNRYDRMKITHPKIYDFCMNKLNYKLVFEWYLCGKKKKLNYFYKIRKQ